MLTDYGSEKWKSKNIEKGNTPDNNGKYHYHKDSD